MAGWTNRGKYNSLNVICRNGTEVTNYYIFLALASAAPTADTNVKSDLNEIATGNGYIAGGISLNRDATDWDVLTEDDTNDRALIQLKDITWTASGGNLPSSGNGARYAVVTDDNATPANREVWWYFDLVSDRTVSIGQTLTLQNCEFRLNES